jgi:hypothetical protein
MKTQNLRLIGIVIAVSVLLLIPYIAMKVTGEVKWSAFDFVVAGALLFGAGLAVEIALRLVTKLEYRIAACVGILVVLAVVWAELAVGLIGTPLAGS